ELDLAHLADGHVGGDLGPARLRARRPAVGAGDLELVTGDVDGVVGHGQVADAHPHAGALPDVERVDTGKGAAVPGPQVEVEHGVDLGHVAARLDVVGVEQEAEVAVNARDVRVRLARVRDPETHHAHRHLHHLVGVRVVHE